MPSQVSALPLLGRDELLLPFWDPDAARKRRVHGRAAVDEIHEVDLPPDEVDADDGPREGGGDEGDGAEDVGCDSHDRASGDECEHHDDVAGDGSGDDFGNSDSDEEVVVEHADEDGVPRRAVADVVMVWPGHGKITYYPKGDFFEAVCFNREHKGKCQKSRVAHGTASRPAQGRPLGLLSAFLMDACDWPCKLTHEGAEPSHDQRSSARIFCRLGFPTFACLEEKGRMTRDDEFEDEPEDLP